MARSSRGGATATRPKARRTPRPSPKPPRRRGQASRTAPRSPLLTVDQRRELGGVGAVGAGLILATVLAVPGGGTVARPVHDGFLQLLGAGAWLAAAGLVVAGVRILAERTWTGGLLGAMGSAVTTVSVLGLLGLAASGSAGWMGQRIGPGLAHRLGSAGTGSALVVAASLGLVLAVELRMRRLAAAAGGWWAGVRAKGAERKEPVAAAPTPGAAALPEPLLETVGRPGRAGSMIRTPPPMGGLELGLEPVDLVLDVPSGAVEEPPGQEPTAAVPAPAPLETFRREFEALPLDVDAAGPDGGAATLAAALAAAADGAAVAEDEPEKVWVLPTAELFDTVKGKRERLEQEIRATAATIESTLASFGIDARIRGVNSGPTV